MQENRTPIVAILGHVNHGKTTILDYIRNAHVQLGEVGGITQKISAFTVDKNGKKITFIDTPGHEAFDLMRLRGGTIADIVLLIVAGNDGVMPQTLESIEIVKNSQARPILVINKIDMPGVDLEKIKRDVSNQGILLEGFGGKVPVCLVSGKTGEGIDNLLETISLVSEVEGLVEREKLEEGIIGKGYVLESIKDKSKGNVSTIVITQGELDKGNWIGYMSKNGIKTERIKGLITEESKQEEKLNTGFGGKILGLSDLIELGTEIVVTEEKNEKVVNTILKEDKVEEEIAQGSSEPLDLSALFGETKEEEKKTLKVVIKASSEGALEAIRKSLAKIQIDDYSVEIVKDGVGDITLADVEMAKITKSIVLGFEVGYQQGVEEFSIKNKILLRKYNLIYKLIDEITDAIESLTLPVEAEEEIGSGDIKQIFTLSNGEVVIGFKITKGIFRKGGKVYVVRGDDIVLEGKIQSIRHLKDTIVEASTGMECGVILDTKGEVHVGDTLYCYKIIK